MILAAGSPVWAAESSLGSNTSLTREGYFVLSWNLGSDQSNAVLQQAGSTQFTDVIERSIPASGSITLSGFDDGAYYFRAGIPDRWSNTVQVDVQHHSLARALGFFSLGLMLFIILVITIVRGNRDKGL